jgi:hypothetical protein
VRGIITGIARGIAILLANTNTDTDTKVLLIRIMPQELCTALIGEHLAVHLKHAETFLNLPQNLNKVVPIP